MQTQLAERYLSASSSYGIYLAIWVGPARWGDKSDDDRRRRCAKIDPDPLAAELALQADALRGAGYHITPVILDASVAA